jgi:LCP family protein required for cell wall assembly
MRTTLKRGMGRAATVNGAGNGRAVLPPGVVEPMRRYSQPPPPPRSTRSTAAKVFGWILLALVVVVTGLAGGLYLYAHETLNAIAPHSAAIKKSQKDLASVPAPSEAAVALVIGYDARAGSEGFGLADSRSDTIMLIRADPQSNTLSMLSFPRDLQVPIYCDPTTPIKTDRINSAWSSCGTNGNARGTLDTVEKLTGSPVNYLITVNFHGFKLLVNKMHGVYMQVDHRYINTQGGPNGFATINLEPGYQKLDGQQALDFVRFRHTDSDLYRLARQQLFLEALKDRLASGLSLTSIPPIIGALKNNVVVVRGGGGAVGFKEIESYAGLASHLGGGHLFRVQIPNLVDCGFLNAEVCSAPADIQSAVGSFMHPDVSLPTRANDAALGRKPHEAKQPKLQRSQITALVLNGTTATGLARDTSFKLGLQGFHTVLLPDSIKANAPTDTYDQNYIYYDAVQANAKEAARQVAIAFGPHTVTAPLPQSIAPLALEAGNPLVVAVVGSSFSGELIDPKATIVATPTHETPSVRNDPSYAVSSLEAVRTHVGFPLMSPGVIESGSYFAQNSPVRAYKPAPGHGAVCLTFHTAAGNVYWQIMETNWTDAPILRHPTQKVTLAGRKVQLYTVGEKIHMVVLRQGNASYWVINTLRDDLSNETMLAIAKGLRPLTAK